MFVNEITAEQLKTRLEAGEDFQLLDIRSEPEVQQGILPGSKHLPMHLIPLKLQDLPKDKDVGPSGTCIAASEFDRRIGFEDLPTAGAFMVFDATRDMFEVARNYVHFFAHESCGFCTPCRVGTSMLKGIMDKIHGGRGSLHEIEEMSRLNPVLRASAHCGLGHTACNPVLDTLKHFRPAYERRLTMLRFAPDFDLDAALESARQMTGRTDPGAHLDRTT